MTDLDSAPPLDSAASNAPPFSVSELAGALKRTLEDRFGFVRLRGEISKVTRHASGHVYLTLKDERAAIDGVIWKGLVRGLAAQPEQGLEVIVTGKITTFPASSKYQIVIEAMEAAGAGALLAQLERLKARLAGEGLFAPERKKSLPASPAVIGVITSPTGAVIRDILHRIRDRWPCRVIVWPVIVQGDQAAAQVRAAIEGFAALEPDGVLPRPDLLIVARGGGSIEDLWAFNDEALARAVAACPLPVISAVGHETDTTLIDFVSDRRAPTPTAAAEMATPVLSDLKALLSDLDGRRLRALGRSLDEKAGRLRAAERGLPNLPDLFALSEQRFDLAAARLSQGLERHIAAHERRAAGAFSRLSPQTLPRLIDAKAERLTALDGRLRLAGRNRLERARQAARLPDIALRLDAALKRRADAAQDKLDQKGALLRSLDPQRPLRQGFALVRRDSGAVAHSAAQLKPGETVSLTFAEDHIDAVIAGAAPSAPSPVKKSRSGGGDERQADLF